MDHLMNAVMKCYRASPPNWAGYLLPKEILALNDIVEIDQVCLDVALYWKRNGLSGGRWTYFKANDEFLKLKGVL